MIGRGAPARVQAPRVQAVPRMRPPRGTTALQLDPLASISARGFLVVVAVVSLLVAVGLTLVTTEQISSWPLAVAALVVLAAGFGWFVRSAFRFDLGVTSDRFATAFALIAIATVLNSLSCLGSNIVVRDDWGLITLGLALMAAAPFRTHTEIGTYVTVSSVVVLILVVLHELMSFRSSAIPVPVTVLVALAPILALGLGAVAYARSLLYGIYSERLEQADERDQQFDQLRREFVDDDVVGGIGGLRSDIVPFLGRVRQSGVLIEADRLRAAELALRLQGALDTSAQQDSLGDHVGVLVDESALSTRLHEDDRATIRALLIALEASPLTEKGSIILELLEGESDRFGMVRCSSDDVRALRTDVLPFIRMTLLMFHTATEQVVGRELLVQFDIDRLG